MRARISSETFEKLKKDGKVIISSFTPIDKKGCDCESVVKDWNQKASQMKPKEIKKLMAKGPIICPRSKEDGYKKYEVICSACGDVLATVSSKDESLKEWCDLHYVSEAKIRIEKVTVIETKQKIKVEHGEWHGAMAVNVSPVDGQLGFECACGNDTRDFRTKDLTNVNIMARMKENMKGREFNQKDSKYILKEIK